MSEVLIDNEQDPEAPETGLSHGVAHRSYAAELTAGDGRTVDVRIVPYGERIVHNDGLGGVPKGMPYTEEVAFGCFSNQLNAAHRVYANFEHQPGIAGLVGRGVALREDSDALYGSFRIFEGSDGDKTLSLVNEGALDGISFEAIFKKSVRTAEGVVRRVRAHLDAVAFCRFPAYQSAQVLGVREEAALLIDEELLPHDPDPKMIERCRRLGIALPERYTAHPAETGTPAEAGTPEDGTRLDHQANNSSEVHGQ